VAGSCECGNELSGAIKCGNFLTTWRPVSFSKRTVLHGVSNRIASICTGLCRVFTGPTCGVLGFNVVSLQILCCYMPVSSQILFLDTSECL